MLRVAIPNKGTLADSAGQLLREAGYSHRDNPRELVALDPVNDVEFFFLRPRDIALYVGSGALDVGISGRDLVVDSQADVVELLPLNFGHSRFCYAAPPQRASSVDQLATLRIATSLSNVVRQDFASRGSAVEVIHLDGAVETAIKLGVADAIADVVETGQTLRELGLHIVGEPILRSEAVLIARSTDVLQRDKVSVLVQRLQGVVLAGQYVMMEYDLPEVAQQQACAITPGIESPTISPLQRDGWIAVKAMVPRAEANNVMDRLYELGARGIFMNDIRACRL